MFLFYIKTLLLSTDFVNSGGVVYAIGELVDLFNEKGLFAIKIRRKHLLYVKLFLRCRFFEFTYSVFLRHSLDFDGVMW